MKQSNQCGHQKVACDVRSCMHNQCMECGSGITEGVCSLAEIHVAPKCGCHTHLADESVCASYKARK
ncbi:MAG: hypothetical protein IKV74_06930 [Clostridia bacterium]|nr:hypothetical protein [Clostridia bacterium]